MPPTKPINITVRGPSDETFTGDRPDREKGESLYPLLEVVTPETVDTYFPQSSPENRAYLRNRIGEGLGWFAVALHPESRTVVGTINVNREDGNLLSLEVTPEFRRRGVASAMISYAQQAFDYLRLQDHASKPGLPLGKALYTKNGFKETRSPGNWEWRRTS